MAYLPTTAYPYQQPYASTYRAPVVRAAAPVAISARPAIGAPLQYSTSFGTTSFGAPSFGAPVYGAPIGYGARAAPVVSYGYPGARVVSAPRYTLGSYSQKGYEQRHVSDTKLTNLKQVRAACGLQNIPVAVGLMAFKKAAADTLTRDVFDQAYTDILISYGMEAPTQDISAAVFDLFDRDGNGVVDMMELVCAISLLCQGTEDDKIAAVFKAFDEDGDGFVSKDEMCKFLLSVFRVVLTPAVAGIMRAQGVEIDSPEDLAAVTTDECFKDADLNGDGKLSIDEFRKWFYEPSTDPSLVFSPIKNIFH